MASEALVLKGTHVRLEPLNASHIEGLVEAAAEDPLLYRWTSVPQDRFEALRYVETALKGRDAGTVFPFAIVRVADGVIAGSTRLWNLEKWPWGAGHSDAERRVFDACEIGHTWLSGTAVRTAVNTEAKLLMLRHAFEAWGVLRVCLHTDVRNERSRAAIERIGGRFEGVLRAHKIAADETVRDSARFSIVAPEWPAVKLDLFRRLAMR